MGGSLGVHFLANGHLMMPAPYVLKTSYYKEGLLEVDLNGKIYREYAIPGGQHHDFRELSNGNLLVASDSPDLSSVEDYVVEIDRESGEVVWELDMKDLLDIEDGASASMESDGSDEEDWFHNNGLWYDEENDLVLLSARHKDAIVAVHKTDKKIAWILGDPTGWDKTDKSLFFTPTGDDFEWFYAQHCVSMLDNGDIMLFDNGTAKVKRINNDNRVTGDQVYSRAVIYHINTDDMSVSQVYEYGKERGSKFYSPYISDVDYIDSNHYIVHSGGIVEVDGIQSNKPAGLTSGNTKLTSDTVEVLDDKVIFELVLPTNNYRVEKMSLYSNSDELKIKRAKRLGSLGKTNVTKNEIFSLYSVKKQDNEYKKHDIKLVKEEDRLSVTGKFKRGSDVNVILYKNLKSSYYKINVSKHPYTALCVDVFTEEENKNGITVTKYINSESLSGNYSVYISINGKVYNTNKSVEF